MKKLSFLLLILGSYLSAGVQLDFAVEDTFGKGLGYKANYVSGLVGVTTFLDEQPLNPFFQGRVFYFPATDWNGLSGLAGVAFGCPDDKTISRIYGTVDYFRRTDEFFQIGYGMIFPTPIGGIFAEYNHPISLGKVFEEEFFDDYIGDYFFGAEMIHIPCQLFRFGIENKINLLPWIQAVARLEGYYFRNQFRPSVWGGAICLRANIGSNASVFIKGGYDHVFKKTLIAGLQIDLYRTSTLSEDKYCFPFPWVEREPIPVLDQRFFWRSNY